MSEQAENRVLPSDEFTELGAIPELNVIDPLSEFSSASGVAPAESGTTEVTPQVMGLANQIAEWLHIGGPVVMILLAMSVLALALVLIKLMHFYSLRVGHQKPAIEALRHWQAGRAPQALAVAQASKNPTAQALAQAMRGLQRGLPERVVREEVLRYGSDVLFHLRRGLRPLEVIGSLAPLLGLLGTVLGMIKAFQQLQAAGNQVNPAVLSGGIWEALLTTAVGLCVAIPVVALLNWLERRVDHLAHHMDNTVTQVFTESLAQTDAEPARSVSSNRSAKQQPAEVRHAEPRTLQPA